MQETDKSILKNFTREQKNTFICNIVLHWAKLAHVWVYKVWRVNL